MNKRISVTGYKGKIGSALIRAGCVPLDCDVTDTISIQRAINSVQPELIVHCAFRSNVDWCEKPENGKELASVNLRGSYNLFLHASDRNIPVVFLSSDHVFGGSVFEYKEDSQQKPVNQYGLSKMAAESLAHSFDNVKIVRASTVFDYDWERIQEYVRNFTLNRTSYVPTFLKRNFIYLPHFVEGLMYYIENIEKMPKVLHIAGQSSISWYEFIFELSHQFGIGNNKLIIPRHVEESNYLGAPRPHNVKLSVKKAKELGVPLYSFVAGIHQMWVDQQRIM